MTRAKISEYSATANDNTDVNGVNIAEGCPPSSMNNMGREIMAALKRFQVGSDGDGVTVGGQLAVTGTTTTSPAIVAAGDTNTGIFFPAADTIAFAEGGAEAMRIDSNGSVGIGTTTPSVALNLYRSSEAFLFVDSDTAASVRTSIHSDNTNAAGLQMAKYRGTVASPSAVNSGDGAGQLNYLAYGGTNIRAVARIDGFVDTYTSDTNISGNLRFLTNSGGTGPTERMRITSGGSLLVGTTSPLQSARVSVLITGANAYSAQVPSGSGAYLSNNPSVASYNHSVMAQNGVVVGTITVNTTATAYNTSSDYRLKENIAPMTGALATVAQLNPVTYNWKADGSTGQGFIAHELQEVAPYAVSGEKDGEEMQGVDYGKITPLLTAALQEAIAEIQSLKARVAELEAK